MLKFSSVHMDKKQYVVLKINITNSWWSEIFWNCEKYFQQVYIFWKFNIANLLYNRNIPLSLNSNSLKLI